MTVLTQFHGKDRMTAFKALKESLINPPSLGHPNYQIPFVLFVNEKEGHAPGVLIQKQGINMDPSTLESKAGPCGSGIPLPVCLRTTVATALLVKATEKVVVGSHLTMVVTHILQAFLFSHHTQHLSVP